VIVSFTVLCTLDCCSFREFLSDGRVVPLDDPENRLL
jgi:hypothetical protein